MASLAPLGKVSCEEWLHPLHPGKPAVCPQNGCNGQQLTHNSPEHTHLLVALSGATPSTGSAFLPNTTP